MSFIEISKGVKLYYEDWGTGSTILFVHGWTMSHDVWSYQKLYFSDKCRTIAMDLRGHGKSSKPLSCYSYAEYAMDLRNFIMALNLKDVVLVGWSMGSAICVEYLRLFGSDRINAFVSAAGAIPKYVQSPDWPYGLPPQTIASWFESIRQRRPELSVEFANGIFQNPMVGDATKDWIWNIIMEASFLAAERSLVAIANADFRSFIPYISIPIYLFQGALDDVTLPGAAAWIAANNANAKLVMFEQSGHTLFIEEKDKFNKMLHQVILERGLGLVHN